MISKWRKAAAILSAVIGITSTAWADSSTWVTPKLNEIPPGASNGITQYAFSGPVFDPSSNQLIQVWGDSMTSFLYYSAYNGTSWTTGAPIPPGGSTGVINFLNAGFDSASNQLVQTWIDGGTGLLYYSVYNGTSWTTGAAIPPGTSTSASNIFTLVFDTGSNQLLQLWQDGGTGFLYYSAFNGTSWTTGPVSTASANSGAFLTFFDPISNQLIGTWIDSATGFIYYSTYNGTSWTAQSQIPPGASSGVAGSLHQPAFDAASNQIIQVWKDAGAGNFLYYSVYNGTSWTTALEIPPGASTGVVSFSDPVYYQTSNQIVQVWQDVGVGNYLYSSTYNGTSWTPGSLIPKGPSSPINSGGYNDPIFNPVSNRLVLVWSATSDLLYSSDYNGSAWTTATQIPLGYSFGVEDFAGVIFDSVSNQLVQIWQDVVNNSLYYATNSGGGWRVSAPHETPASNQIPLGSSVGVFIFAYDNAVDDPAANQLVQVWQDSGTGNFLYYSAYPFSGNGSKITNQFPLETEWYNQFQWTALITPGITGYNIRRNGQLIASGYTETQYKDYNRPKNGTDVYTVTAVDASGNESSPITITVE